MIPSWSLVTVFIFLSNQTKVQYSVNTSHGQLRLHMLKEVFCVSIILLPHEFTLGSLLEHLLRVEVCLPLPIQTFPSYLLKQLTFVYISSHMYFSDVSFYPPYGFHFYDILNITHASYCTFFRIFFVNHLILARPSVCSFSSIELLHYSHCLDRCSYRISHIYLYCFHPLIVSLYMSLPDHSTTHTLDCCVP